MTAVKSLASPKKALPRSVFYGQIVGSVLRGHRERIGFTLLDVARTIDLGTSGWSRIETGSTSITLNQLCKVGAVLRVRPDELLRQIESIAGRLSAKALLISYEKPPTGSQRALSAGEILAILETQ